MESASDGNEEAQPLGRISWPISSKSASLTIMKGNIVTLLSSCTDAFMNSTTENKCYFLQKESNHTIKKEQTTTVIQFSRKANCFLISLINICIIFF